MIRTTFFLGFNAARCDTLDAMESGEAWDKVRSYALDMNDGKRPQSYKIWQRLIEYIDAEDL